MPKSIAGWILPSKDDVSRMNLNEIENQLQLAMKAKRNLRKIERHQNRQILQFLAKNGHTCMSSKCNNDGKIPEIIWCGLDGTCVGKRCKCGRLHIGNIRCDLVWPMKVHSQN